MCANKWEASERAANRAMAALAGTAFVVKYGMEISGKASVECASPEDAKAVAKLLGGKVARSGSGYPANTVVLS